MITCDNGVREEWSTALAMLLYHLSYPRRLSDVHMSMGWEPSRFSRVITYTAYFIYNHWKHLLRWDTSRLTPHKLADYARAIHEKGSPLPNCFGFIDGTLRKMARPVRNQRLVYNGWKHFHTLKYHSVVAPDGIHIHVWGPVEAHYHDATLYQQSGIADILDVHAYDSCGKSLVLYGDPAYGIQSHLISPYGSTNITPDQQKFNSQMSKCRQAVEWGFGEVVRIFPFLDFSKNMRLLLQPVGIYYLIGILLCNAHTILHQPAIPRYSRSCANP